jgi:hypothetical protein
LIDRPLLRAVRQRPRPVNPLGRRRLLTGLLFTALLSVPAEAAVITVGPAGSGANFTSISAAVAAAQPGDRILVAPGTYARFVLDKPVSVIGSAPGTVFVQAALTAPAVRISDLDAGEEGVVAELSVLPVAAQTLGVLAAPLIVVNDNAGVAVLQHVTLSPGLADQSLDETLEVRDTQALYLLDSVVDGYDENTVLGGGLGGGHGIEIERSGVWILGSAVTGGDAAVLTGWFAAPAGAGIEAEDSVLRLARTSVQGGSGGSDFFGASTDGQPGLVLSDCDLEHAGGPGSQLFGGAGAIGALGAPGVDVQFGSDVTVAPDVYASAGIDGDGGTTAPDYAVDPSSTLSSFKSLRPTLAVSVSGVPLGTAYTVESDSQPFAVGLHWIALGFGAPLTLPGVDGEVAISPAVNFYLLALGADATGHASYSVKLVPSPVLTGLRIVHQSFELPTAGFDLIASNPASVVLLP